MSEILAPLATDDATIDTKTGGELLELLKKIGYAEGYAQCTCLPRQPLPETELASCAREESYYYWLFEQAVARCVVERSRELPGFDQHAQCTAKNLRSLGRRYAQCAEGSATNSVEVEPHYECPGAQDVEQLLAGNTCHDAFSCSDGTFLNTGHCDLKRDCADGSDERGCGEFVCGDKLLDRSQACDPEACPIEFNPPLCAAGDPAHVQCGDGSEISIAQLCDKLQDCRTGRDERYCY